MSLRSGIQIAIFGKAFSAVLAFLLSIALARILDVDEVGVYSLGLSLVMFVAIFSRLGLDNVILRTVSSAMAREQSGHADILSETAVLLSLCAGVLLGALFAYVAIPLLAQRSSVYQQLALLAPYLMLWLVLLSMQTLIAEGFRGRQRIGAYILFGGMISVSITLAIYTWFIVNESDVNTLIAVRATILGLFVGVAGSALYYRQAVRSTGVSPYSEALRGQVKPLLNESKPLLFYNLCAFLIAQGDIWLVGSLVGESEAGVYAMAFRIVAILSLAINTINVVIPPMVVGLHEKGDKAGVENLIRMTATMASMACFAGFAVLFVFASDIMAIVYGEQYRDGAVVLRLLALGQLIITLSGSCGYALILLGHRVTILKISLITVTVIFGVGVYVARTYGMEGVAALMMLAMLLHRAMMCIALFRHEGILTVAGLKYIPQTLKFLGLLKKAAN